MFKWNIQAFDLVKSRKKSYNIVKFKNKIKLKKKEIIDNMALNFGLGVIINIKSVYNNNKKEKY